MWFFQRDVILYKETLPKTPTEPRLSISITSPKTSPLIDNKNVKETVQPISPGKNETSYLSEKNENAVFVEKQIKNPSVIIFLMPWKLFLLKVFPPYSKWEVQVQMSPQRWWMRSKNNPSAPFITTFENEPIFFRILFLNLTEEIQILNREKKLKSALTYQVRFQIWNK